jgi:hypothetical protein
MVHAPQIKDVVLLLRACFSYNIDVHAYAFMLQQRSHSFKQYESW